MYFLNHSFNLQCKLLLGICICKIHIIALNSGKNDTNMCKNQYTSMQQGQTQYVMSTNNTCSNQVNAPFTRNCRTKLHFSLPLNMQYEKANVRKITLLTWHCMHIAAPIAFISSQSLFFNFYLTSAKLQRKNRNSKMNLIVI